MAALAPARTESAAHAGLPFEYPLEPVADFEKAAANLFGASRRFRIDEVTLPRKLVFLPLRTRRRRLPHLVSRGRAGLFGFDGRVRFRMHEGTLS
jgi:hypothetical protein